MEQEINQHVKAELLLVGFISNGENSILTVGIPQPGGTSEVINAFQGEAAVALYETLFNKNPDVFKEDKEDKNEDLQGENS